MLDFEIDFVRDPFKPMPVEKSFGNQPFRKSDNVIARALRPARSALVLYSFSSSESECEYGRMQVACTKTGVRCRRQCSTASVIVS